MASRFGTVAPRVATVDPRRVKPPSKVGDPFYSSVAWRRLLDQLIKARGRRCERCGRTHDADGEPIRVFGDHIKELRDGGAPLDPSNIQLLDSSCHMAKTAVERARRMSQ